LQQRPLPIKIIGLDVQDELLNVDALEERNWDVEICDMEFFKAG
jgi:hypothetical protein